jgi:hypothetical protein
MDNEDGSKNPLVVAAEAVERSRAIARGYLKKQSSGKSAWQRRFFMILPGESGSYFLAYSKTEALDSPILASMDLAQAGAVHAVEGGDGRGCQFGLQWDKHRVFMAGNADECQMWISTIRRVQAERARRGGAGGSGGAGAKDWGGGRRSADKAGSGGSGGCCGCSVQ